MRKVHLLRILPENAPHEERNVAVTLNITYWLQACKKVNVLQYYSRRITISSNKNNFNRKYTMEQTKRQRFQILSLQHQMIFGS